MKRRAAIILFLIVAVVLIFAVLFGFRQRNFGEQVLSDGTVVTLVGFTVGDKHNAPARTIRERVALFLSPKWRNRFKIWTPPSTSSEVSSNYLSIWYTARKKDGTAPPIWKLAIADDRGNISFPDESYCRWVFAQVDSNLWMQGVPVQSWPRRAETLRIQFYPERSQRWGKPLAEFRVKNPRRDLSTPPWNAPPWPVTVRDGDLEFTLTSLWLGVGWVRDDWKLWPQKDPLSRNTRATFSVTKEGELQTNWVAFQVREIRDATGNWTSGNGHESKHRAGETMNQFNEPPPPAGEAWRMTVEFSRTGGFEPGELRTVKNFPLPQTGQPQPQPFVSPGPPVLEVRWEASPLDSSPHIIWASTKPESSDHRLTLVSAVDNLGRNVPSAHFGFGPGSVGEKLSPQPDATSVDLVFAYHPGKRITFQARPEFYLSAQK